MITYVSFTSLLIDSFDTYNIPWYNIRITNHNSFHGKCIGKIKYSNSSHLTYQYVSQTVQSTQ